MKPVVKKLEINQAFSISDKENSQRGTTTTTSGTNRRKGNITKGKKEEEIRSQENSDTTSTTSRTNRATSDSNCIEIHAKQAFQRVGCDQVNWS